MSEPDDPRWLNEISDELRAAVPVRAAWRSRLLDDVAHERRPSTDDPYDDRITQDDISAADAIAPRRRIVLSPLAGIAAALLFATIGAGLMYATLSARRATNSAGLAAGATRDAPAGAATALTSNAGASSDRELVRFALSAPNASHVALVGSFNEWNPVATPLVRDPATGTWMVSVRLPAGRHVYAFVVDGDVTSDPAAPRTADDDFGSSNSVVLVSGHAS